MISGCIDFSKDTCKENIITIGSACKQYAKEHKGKYPQNLDVLIKKGYIKEPEILKCTKHDCKYIYITKYIKKSNINYFILKCQKYLTVYDSKLGYFDFFLIDLDDEKMKYVESLLDGKYFNETILTNEELKKLGWGDK